MPKRGRYDFWQPGDWNAACSLCGRKRKASGMVKNWQGQWRCPEHNEPRQPQDFVRGVLDIQAPAWVQDERDFDIQVCTLNSRSSIPGFGLPGCEVPGYAVVSWEAYEPAPEPYFFYLVTETAFTPIATESGLIITTGIGEPISYLEDPPTIP